MPVTKLAQTPLSRAQKSGKLREWRRQTAPHKTHKPKQQVQKVNFTEKAQQLAQQVNDLLTSTNTKVDGTNELTYAPTVEVFKKVLENNNLSTCNDNVSNLAFTHGWLFS